MLVHVAHTDGQRQAIELEASRLEVRHRRRLLAIGEEQRIQALVLRRGRQRREEEREEKGGEQQRAGTHTQG